MKRKKLLSYVLVISMGVSLFSGMTLTAGAEPADDSTVSHNEAIQELIDNFNSGFNEDGSVDASAYDYLENSEAEESALSALALDDETYPATFDLRHVDGTVTYNEETKQNDITGGTSYVTPVKSQTPWGTCWAFGAIASCETSILYEAGLGTDTVDNNNIDLSEHHLAWFAKNHIPDIGETGSDLNSGFIDGQYGEGTHYLEDVGNYAMEDGESFYGVQAFASGMGVVSEEDYPYRGKNGEVVVKRKDTADQSIYKYRYLWCESIEAFEAASEDIQENYYLYYYYYDDDWSIDESERFKQDYALEEGNVLPTAAAVIGSGELNADGVNAIKEELLDGKAVNIGYYSDQFSPSQIGQELDSRYINSNYAHYCWDRTNYTHSVCIVGWDDDYDASNFGQETVVKYDENGYIIYKLKDSDQELAYDDDGTLYYIDAEGVKHVYESSSDEIEIAREDGSDSVPPGNGAWIVKNSWGAATNDFPNYTDWGVDGSGYFYLSYYDTSIHSIGTYDFAVTEEEKEDYDYSLIDQYDLMIPETVSQSTVTQKTIMANVFTADEDMEVTVLSCETTTPGTEVVYGVCLLDDDEDYPANEDDIKFVGNETYKYGGYHSIVLDDPLILAEGQKYAVIAIESYEKDGSTTYCICGNSNYAKDGSGILISNGYQVGVINPGESYIGTYGDGSDKLNWTDYYDFISTVKDQDADKEYYTYDNFSLKAYGKEATVTGLVEENGSLVYYVGNVRQHATDVVKIDGTWYNLVDGVVTAGPTVAKNSNGWWYINSSGKVDFGFNGFASNANGTWYIQNGKVNFLANGVLKGIYNGVSKWGNVKSGQLQKAVTVAKNSNGWWYIGSDGFVNFSFTGLAKNSNGWWYCKGGKVQFNVNDVLKTTYNGTTAWYNIRGGKLVANTVAKNSNGWWYIDKYGKVDFTYNGLAKNANGTWYCKGGKVQFGYSGTYIVNYTIKNGKLISTSTWY